LSRTRELLAALTHANVGGFLAGPPALDGDPGLGLAGIHGVPRAKTWDAIVSAAAPELPGDAVAFVVLDDGTVVVDEDLPDGALIPIADAVEATVEPPYRAAAIRSDGAVWTAVAEKVEIVELWGVEEDVVELSVVDGERTLTLDGERTIRPLPALDALTEAHGDVVVYAERVDGDLFAADVFPL
jgi:hypothetical protein